jgi:hypothetical protein
MIQSGKTHLLQSNLKKQWMRGYKEKTQEKSSMGYNGMIQTIFWFHQLIGLLMNSTKLKKRANGYLMNWTGSGHMT